MDVVGKRDKAIKSGNSKNTLRYTKSIAELDKEVAFWGEQACKARDQYNKCGAWCVKNGLIFSSLYVRR